MTESLQIILPTTHASKRTHILKNAPLGLDVQTVQPLYDQREIKEKVLPYKSGDGFEWLARVSQGKLSDHRQADRLMHPTEDGMIVVSDACIVLPREDGSYEAIDKDDIRTSSEKGKRALDEINKLSEITLAGAFSFGRRHGNSAFTVMTYFKMPLGRPIDKLPLASDDLPTYADKVKGYEVGYVRHNLDEKREGHLKPVFEPQNTGPARFTDFEIAAPFIYGVTPELLSFAERVGRFDRDTADLAEMSVESHAFNTMIFYVLGKRANGSDLHAFYRDLVNSDGQFFNTFGANCSFFTRDLVFRLKERLNEPVNVIIYPSTIPEDKEGHSAVLVNREGIAYLFDTGLTIPYAIPIDRNIPLFPFKIGSKEILIEARYINQDTSPDLYVLGKQGATPLLALRVLTPEEYEQEMPGILTSLHGKRQYLKIDYHDRKGNKRLGIDLNINTRSLRIRSNGTQLIDMPIEEMLRDPNAAQALQEACIMAQVDFNNVIGQLREMIN